MQTLNLRNNPSTIINGLAVNTFLRTIGMGAVALFVPIYLYQHFGLKVVIAYQLLNRLVEAVLSYKLAKVVSLIGYRKSVVVGSLIIVCNLILFNLSKTYPWLLFVNILTFPIASTLYWLPRHLLILSTDEKKYGQTGSLFAVLGRWSAVLGPIVGALLVNTFQFGGLFEWGIIFILLSIVPLWLLEPDRLNWQFHLQSFWQKLEGRWFRKDLIAYVGYGLEETMFEYYWVVFLFINLSNSYLSLGSYKTALLLISSLAAMFVGRYLDKHYKNHFMVWASVIISILWILRGLGLSNNILLSIDLIDGIAAIFLFVSFEFYTMHRNRHADAVLYTFERETALNLGRVLAGVGVGTFYFLGLGWQWMTVFGIVGVILMNFLPKDAITKTNTS